MIAIDTNIVVHLLVADDPTQTAYAAAGTASEFATFDRALARHAAALGVVPAVRLCGG